MIDLFDFENIIYKYETAIIDNVICNFGLYGFAM